MVVVEAVVVAEAVMVVVVVVVEVVAMVMAVAAALFVRYLFVALRWVRAVFGRPLLWRGG